MAEVEEGAVRAIDVHAHYGPYHVDGLSELENRFKGADAATVVERSRLGNTDLTLVSPLSGLLPRGRADAVAANEEASRTVANTPGLLQWVILHPLQPETFAQVRRMLSLPTVVGIKIHPEEHQYPIAEHGQLLFELAAELGAVVLAHSGDELSKPADFLPFADAFPEVPLILAHLGNGGLARGSLDLQVRAIQAARHGNVWTDTSSARSLTPELIEWGVREVGAERILYGTDTPIYFAPSQRARIDAASLSLAQRRRILRDNAITLLPLAGRLAGAAASR